MSEVGTRLRIEVRARAKGRCEYCRLPESVTLVPHEVDHIIAVKHGGETSLENLALCCTLCNKHKGTDLASIDPETGNVERLFHPRKDVWPEHFRVERGTMVGLTAVGRVTIRLLQWNRTDRVRERILLLQAGLL